MSALSETIELLAEELAASKAEIAQLRLDVDHLLALVEPEPVEEPEPAGAGQPEAAAFKASRKKTSSELEDIVAGMALAFKREKSRLRQEMGGDIEAMRAELAALRAAGKPAGPRLVASSGQ